MIDIILDNISVASFVTIPIFLKTHTALWVIISIMIAVFIIQYVMYKNGKIKTFPKFLDIGLFALNISLLITYYIIPEKDRKTYAKYQDVLIYSGLTIITLLSLIINHPFTIDYAKEETSPDIWSHTTFISQNKNITRVWILLFIVMGISSSIPIVTKKDNNKTYRIIFVIIIPILLFIFGRMYR